MSVPIQDHIFADTAALAVSPQACFARNCEVVSRQIEGELILVPIRRGVGDLTSLYTLNAVGAVLWDYLIESRTVTEMVARVCDEFDVATDQAHSDIQEFIQSLVEEKLVQPAS
jgi:hypothetical protein